MKHGLGIMVKAPEGKFVKGIYDNDHMEVMLSEGAKNLKELYINDVTPAFYVLMLFKEK